MDQYKTKADVLDAISYPFIGLTTNNTDALKMLVDQGFQYGRPDARKVAVIVTDGQSGDRFESFQQAAIAHSAKISILGIGINVKSNYGRQQLNSFVSDPDELNYMEVDSSAPEQLYVLAENITRTICNGKLEWAITETCYGDNHWLTRSRNKLHVFVLLPDC